MKQKFFLTLFFSASLLLIQSGLLGQDNEDEPIKLFGLGMHIEQFKLVDIASDITTAPANKIMLTITPNNKFRIEPEVGLNFFNDKESELKNKSIHFGVGTFGMFQRGKVNLYTGLRFEYANISVEYFDWNTGDKSTERINRISLGPAIGAEYFFGKHFSFGGEISLKYMNLKSKDGRNNNGADRDEVYFTTDSGLLLRFYF